MTNRNVKLIGYVTDVYRIVGSRNGNPRYEVIITDPDGKGQSIRQTGVDSMVGYAITNPEYRGVPVEFTFNSYGHIVRAMPIHTLTEE